MSNKIIADVPAEVKKMLSDIAYAERSNMKTVLIRLIEQEHGRVEKNSQRSD